MCDPMTLAMTSFGMSAASQITGFMGQRSAARQQNAMFVQNNLAANEAAKRQYNDTGLRQQQESEASYNDQFQSMIAAKKTAATAEVAAGEAGVSGISVDSLLGDIYGNEARNRAVMSRQNDWSLQQLQRNKEGIAANATDRTNSVARARAPSFIQLGLGIGSAGLSNYAQYKHYSTPKES